jgi:glycosyltransferase involved in cell wall biosynthesis
MSLAVLQLVPELERGGSGQDAVDLACHARACGWRSFVAGPGGPPERELAAAGCTHLREPFDGRGPLAHWRAGRRLAAAIRAHGIDVVHAHGTAAAGYATAATRATGVQLVMTPDEPETPPTGAERVIAVSEYMVEELTARHGLRPDRLRLVHRWIDADEFDPERVRGHRVQALAERWQLEHGPKVVLVPPLHAEDRGHLLLVQALARLPRTDCVVLFTGAMPDEGSYPETLLATVRRAGLGERVRFGGVVDDFPAALSFADVVVVPATRPDPSGITAVAAQAMGRPVVVTQCGALPKAVLPAATGWLVPCGAADELARALDLALRLEPEIRRRLASRARAFVRTEFAPGPLGDRTLAVYRELVDPALARNG